MQYIVRSPRALTPPPSSGPDSRMQFVLGRPVESLVQELEGCFTVHAELPQFEGEAVGGRSQPLAALPEGFGVGGLVHYECASATPALERSVGLQLPVGPGHRAGGEAECAGHVSHRWEAGAGYEVADGHHHRELGSELFVEGGDAVLVQANHESTTSTREVEGFHNGWTRSHHSLL